MQPIIPAVNVTRLKYASYMQEHPECRLMTMDAVISIMVKEKKITLKEAKELNSDFLIPDFIQIKNNPNISIVGAEYEQSLAPRTEYVTLSNYHKTFKDLIVKDNGQIDMSQFDINNIKKTYPADRYYISIQPNLVTVFNIETQQPVIYVLFPKNEPDAINYTVMCENSTSRRYYVKQGRVERYTTCSGMNNFTTKIYNRDGNIKSVESQKLGAYKIVEYSNGSPFEEFVNGKFTKNILADKLYKNLSSNTSVKELKKYVMQIDKKNVYKLLHAYTHQNRRDLIEDIQNNNNLNSVVKNNLIQLIMQCMQKSSTNDDKTGQYISALLVDDIYGLGSGKLKEHIKLINKYNVGIVAKKYYELVQMHYMTVFYKALSNHTEGLIEAISNEYGLDESVRNEFITYIKNCALQSGTNSESERTMYTADIKDDIKQHKQDNNKVDIDLIRMGNRNNISNEGNNYIEPNGKFDCAYRQGKIGDCWLIAGITAILETPKGKQELEKLIEYDEASGDCIVTLKGANKKYRITAKEMREFNQLSEGDADIRAIEIAVDRYIKENAYDYKGGHFDIDGNHTTTLFKALFGNGIIVDYNNIQSYDFNNENYAYALGSLTINGNVYADVENTKMQVILREQHAYAIVKADKDYLYLKDPLIYNDNMFGGEDDAEAVRNNLQNIEPILRISKKDIKKMRPAIYKTRINI